MIQGGGGSNIFQGGGGSNCLLPIETHITCDFPGGSGPPVPLWIRTWPMLLALKRRRDVDEGSGSTLSLLWGDFVVVDSFFNIPPILIGPLVWSLLSYTLLGVLSSFAIILTRTRKHDVLF